MNFLLVGVDGNNNLVVKHLCEQGIESRSAEIEVLRKEEYQTYYCCTGCGLTFRGDGPGGLIQTEYLAPLSATDAADHPDLHSTHTVGATVQRR
jgi:hypothetical protein